MLISSLSNPSNTFSLLTKFQGIYTSMRFSGIVCEIGNERESPLTAAPQRWRCDLELYCVQYICNYTKDIFCTT